MTVDAAVAFALENNAELAAIRKEAEAGKELIRQARLRANPSLQVGGTKQMNGDDNSFMIEGGIPLELAGRRDARIRIAEAESEIRTLAAADRERQLAAEVRIKFGEAIAAILKLKFTEETLSAAEQNYNLVSARVDEGRRPPLEKNMEAVELNRIRAAFEIAESEAEIKLLELRSVIGMEPNVPLRLSGDLEISLSPLPDREVLLRSALEKRPDLNGARAFEKLAAARTNQARVEGRIDADVMLGYQRMLTRFPLSGIDASGMLMPIEMRARTFTFGIKFSLPATNRNQGLIAAAKLEEEAAARRREFGETSVRNEVVSAAVRYESARRAAEIIRVGVRQQAAANLEVVRETYEIGSKTLLDYIAEFRRYIETEMNFIDAQFAAYKARVELLRAVNSPELKGK
jgi:cobalt-zinc-cadmium efflux system outer membrane protein